MKKVIMLDSHQLTSFQRCPQQFFLHYVLGLEPQKRKGFYDKGTLTATLLEIHYQRKLKGKQDPQFELYYGDKIIELGVNKLEIPPVEKLLMTQILKQYRRYWKDQDFQPLAVEKGFSKILYEDNDYLFIYEGRPDLIALVDGERIAVDHKTQGQQKSIYAHNNQAIGYCWAANCVKFVYNYIKWTKDDPFRREPYKFTQEQVDAWKSETIGWFKKVADAKDNKEYLKSLQCQGMYGLCDFTEVCEQPKTEVKEWIITRSFKERDRKWQAW